MSEPYESRRLSVVAFDYDGTLTETGRITEEMAQALGAARAAGLRLVLVTGRVLEDLRRECPSVHGLFDRVVAENGAVLARDEGPGQLLAPPVDGRLGRALEARGLLVNVGEVLVGTEARHEAVVREELGRLGIEARVFVNRASLLVAPVFVSKGSGLSHALASLGAEARETLAVGDAQNDREMLELAGLGVAVGDAVPELKAVADRVLGEPNGRGVIGLLRELVKGR